MFEAEQALLGAILPDNRQFFLAPVDADHFTDARHRQIYEVIARQLKAAEPVDVIGIAEQLGKDWLAYATELVDNTPAPENAPYYAERVREHAERKHLTVAFKNAVVELGANQPVADVTAVVMAAVQRASFGEARGKSMREAVVEAKAFAVEAAEHRDGGLGVSSTLDGLDSYIGSLYEPRFAVFGGRPGTYKTTYGWQICTSAAKRGKPVGFISLEMGAWELALKALARELQIPFHQLCGEPGAVAKLQRADTGQIEGWPIWFDDTSKTLAEIRARIAQFHYTHGIQLAVLDYLQLLKTPSKNRFEELGEISRTLKLLAMELNIPVLALAQLNRECEREKRRPKLSDLRECGNIEQDADLVVLLHREEDAEDNDKDTHELILAKNRQGPANVVIQLLVDGKFGAIKELDNRYQGID